MPIYKLNKFEAGQRADKFLHNKFNLTSYSLIQKLFRKKLIKINNKKCQPSAILQLGDLLRYPEFLPTYYQQNHNSSYNNSHDGFGGTNTKKSQNSLAKIPITEQQKEKFFWQKILQASINFIAIDKAHNLATQGGSKLAFSLDDIIKSIENEELRAKFPKTPFEFEKMMLVHRLDISTTGVILLALNRNTAKNIGQQFKAQQVKKTYLAICVLKKHTSYNTATNTTAEINIPLSYGSATSHLKTICVGGNNKEVGEANEHNAKPACTRYRVIKVKPYDDARNIALVMVRPKTGRKHQIRCHLANVDMPILGDEKYGGQNVKIIEQSTSIYAEESKDNSKKHGMNGENSMNKGKNIRRNNKDRQLYLHAYRLKITNLNVNIKANIPKDFTKLLGNY